MTVDRPQLILLMSVSTVTITDSLTDMERHLDLLACSKLDDRSQPTSDSHTAHCHSCSNPEHTAISRSTFTSYTRSTRSAMQQEPPRFKTSINDDR
jgi:hypothetical protein